MTMKKYIQYISLIAICASISSCEPDLGMYETEPGNSNGPNSKYVFSYWASNYAQYLGAFNSLEDFMTGEIDMKGYGVEQKGNMIPVGNRFFACSTSEDGGRSYYLDINGDLNTGGREDRIYVEEQYAYGNTEDNMSVIVGASWTATTTGNEILIYDPQSVSYIKRKVEDFGMTVDGEPFLEWPSAVAQSGEYLYISYYPKSINNGWELNKTDTAYVKVLKYPSLEFVADIKDSRTAPIGFYYANTALVTIENGDTYTFSSNASAAGYTPGSKPSAIMRIKKNSTEFDPDYFFNVEESILKGKVLAAYPAGGNKAVIMYIPLELDTADNKNGFFGKILFKMAVIDLPTQRITPVTNLPKYVSGDYFYGFASLFAENGKAYKSFYSGDDSRVYEIDLESGVAKAGAYIRGGLYLPVISKMYY